MAEFDINRFTGPVGRHQYQRQLDRLRADGKSVASIETAVRGALDNLGNAGRKAFVIYGEPQSGKTEMMICLTAKLLDSGRQFILHLLNDSVDLLGQNLGRFQASGLAPAAKNFTDILDPAVRIDGRQNVIFCKKNAKDLDKLFQKIGALDRIVVIDDEADFASPNAKVNQNTKTKINELISDILGPSGDYIGVTATPARLDLNNTFDNDAALWVDFPPHPLYTGQDTFFPTDEGAARQFRLTPLPAQYDAPKFARRAFFSFMIAVAYINKTVNEKEQNYSMLIHTSGKRVDHKADWSIFDQTISELARRTGTKFVAHVKELWSIAADRYSDFDPDELTSYVLDNISRSAIFILNSDRDFVQNGASATNPSSLFTLIIGGNIVSRGVTFDNLLSMFFTRDVKQKIQQDTYIQRARMFGSRGKYLNHFELTIPGPLYSDWYRCFVFHRLALSAIKEKAGSPVWLSDARIAAVASSSIDRSTVDIDRGEMAFGLFPFEPASDELIGAGLGVSETLNRLQAMLGERGFPTYLLRFITRTSPKLGSALAIHTSGSISGYEDGDGIDKAAIERRRGLMGANQLEKGRFPTAVHHLKIFTNDEGRGRLFYKYEGSIQFTKNAGR